MNVKLSEKRFKILIKEGIRDAMNAELMKLRAFFLPYVSKKEQKEIEKLYVSPSKKFVKTCELEI